MSMISSIKENKRLKALILLVFVFSFFFFSIYIVFQQYIRSSANDNPDRITRNVWPIVYNGTMKQFYDTQGEISDLNYPFGIIFDSQGGAGDSPLRVLGKPITLPQGVFDYAKTHGDDRITWEPLIGSRFAAVITYVPTFIAGQSLSTTTGRTGDLYILTAVSLHESELHADETGLLLLKGWIISIILSVAVIFMLF